MSSFFMEDNWFNRMMTKIFDLCLLNLLTFLCCVPIVTAGASLTAMYAVMLKMVENKEGAIIKSFFKEFKSNLKGSIGAWLVILLGFCLLIFDIIMWTQNQVEYRSLFWGLTVAMIIMLCSFSDWYLALRAKFVDKAKTSMKNALKFVIIYLPVSVLMGIYSVGVVYLLTQYPMYVMFVPIFGISMIMYPKAIYIQGRFEKFLKDRGEVELEEDPDAFSLNVQSDSEELREDEEDYVVLGEKETAHEIGLSEKDVEEDIGE